jgi:hypothetical protein
MEAGIPILISVSSRYLGAGNPLLRHSSLSSLLVRTELKNVAWSVLTPENPGEHAWACRSTFMKGGERKASPRWSTT